MAMSGSRRGSGGSMAMSGSRRGSGGRYAGSGEHGEGKKGARRRQERRRGLRGRRVRSLATAARSLFLFLLLTSLLARNATLASPALFIAYVDTAVVPSTPLILYMFDDPTKPTIIVI